MLLLERLHSRSNAAEAVVFAKDLDPQRGEAAAQPFGQRRKHNRLGRIVGGNGKIDAVLARVKDRAVIGLTGQQLSAPARTASRT